MICDKMKQKRPEQTPSALLVSYELVILNHLSLLVISLILLKIICNIIKIYSTIIDES